MAAVLRSRGFGTLSQSTISRWRKGREALRATAQNPNELRFKRIRQTEYPDVDRALQLWILQILGSGRHPRLTGTAIRLKAREFATSLGHPADFLSLSNGWLESLQSRMGLRQHRYHGEAASAPVEKLAAEISRVRTIMDEYLPRDQLNFDETAFYYRLAPDKGLAVAQTSGIKMNKTRITVGLCTNVDGSEKFDPMFIGHARRPRPFGKKDGTELGYDYWWSKSAWMNADIWQRWLANLNARMAVEGRKVLLLCDNAPSHIHDQDQYPNVRVEYFAPNLTAWIQPNDAGIIQSFKAKYKNAYIQKTIERYEKGEPDVFKINQLEAMELAMAAWNQVSPSTITNCWWHTKLSGPGPDTDSPPTALLVPTVSSDVHDSISALQQSLDAFHTRNIMASIEPMGAEEFLSVDADLPTEQELTDDDILEQVREEERQAVADKNGQFLYEEDAAESASQLTAGSAVLQTQSEANASLNGIRAFLARLGSLDESDLAALSSLQRKVANLNNI
ncbi:hypothetical protein FRC10_005290 [Ceratobasidium sp. 414]|nr:hypothetical protein FRC10_005290 [Ceratobasidium sp. 414]